MSENAPLTNDDIQIIAEMKYTYEQIVGTVPIHSIRLLFSVAQYKRGGGSFATFAYSVIPELSLNPRPMVRKGKSLLSGHISRN